MRDEWWWGDPPLVLELTDNNDIKILKEHCAKLGLFDNTEKLVYDENTKTFKYE